MSMLLLFVGACIVPALAFVGLERGFDLLTTWEPRRRRQAPDRDALLRDLAADLRRLAAEHDRLQHDDVPGRPARLRAVRLAYDDTLVRAGAVLDLPLPAPPLEAAARLQAEAELVSAGFDW